MNIEQHQNRDISPRTIRNFKLSKTRAIHGPGDRVIHINLWCENFCLLPKFWREYSVPWWELETTVDRQVNILRIYWMKFGIAIIKPTY